jgi:hypothetical protein
VLLKNLHLCYEAGATGYVLYWQLTALGAKCEVVAPTDIGTGEGGRSEEGTCAAWLHDLLKPHVTEVLVCDSRKNALLRVGNKNDREDARTKVVELCFCVLVACGYPCVKDCPFAGIRFSANFDFGR